nr:hypothetical protein [Tanacetum cinerariifolium]
MALTFVDTHNMITYLTKSDASKGFNQILNFLNASAIQYALTINPNIYVSCIKQFWSSVSIKKTNDVVRLQALIDRKKVIITEDTIHQALRLDDTKSINCLPNEEIFIELVRMGYEKPSTKLTFYKAFFSAQWKLLMMLMMLLLRMLLNPLHHHLILHHHHHKNSLPHHRKVKALEKDKVAQAIKIIKLKQRVNKLEKKNKEGIIAELDADKDVTLEEVDAAKDAEIAKDADDDEPELAKLKEVIEVVTTAKLMTKVVTGAATTAASIITAAPSAARKRKGVVIRVPEETATPSTIVHSKPKSKDKGKGILVEKPKPLKKGMSYDDIRPIFEKYFNSNVPFLEKSKEELEKEASRALKKKSEISEQQATKKQKLDEEVEELKKHLQIVPNDEDDVYTEATPLALKVPVVDYQIHTENNKPYYKIIRADGTHQLFLSFLSLLRNFDKEDLEMLWKLVQERFASSKPKNFSDDFLLNTLKAMFKKPDVEAQVWKNQRSIHGLAKVKRWKLLESCGVHIITFTTTQMMLLVKKDIP